MAPCQSGRTTEMATSKQIDYITALASRKGYKNAREAAVAYGFDAAVSLAYLSNDDASGLIDWLKAPVKSDDQIAAELEAARVHDGARKVEVAVFAAKRPTEEAADRLVRVKEIMTERGLDILTGGAKADARYEISRALKNGEIV